MSKFKYRFNTHSLTYDKVNVSWKNIVLKVFSYLATGTVFTGVTVFIAFTYFDSPKEKILKREIEWISFQYTLLGKKFEQVQTVLADLQKRDDNIYRAIFEAEPIPEEIRKAGFGGVDRYKELESFENSELVIETTKKLDQISKQLYVQSKSFDEIVKMSKNKEQMLSCIPAIQPILNKDPKREFSGFGWRTHPVYKMLRFHTGIDFTIKEGTKIHATGDGVVVKAEFDSGYGNEVTINHGYGYETLYGHMKKITVYVGKKVKRGEVLGYVGSTGLATAPHVHYEVIKNGNKINPIHFFYNDLTPAEYKQMIEISSHVSQSFD
ncbi:MAG: M23 family metallopeptidase [Bacteroidota bacterium]